MTSFDPDHTLRVLRQSVLRWEKEPPGTVAEAEAAEAATSAAAALDQHLAGGGVLPSAWRNARKPTLGELADLPAGTGCTHGGDCPVHPSIQAIHGDIDYPLVAP